MPKNRIGFSTDFNLTNSKVGIGTTNPRATLDVVGTLKGDFNISGVTTLTSYAGFIPQKQNIYFDTTVGIKTVGVGTFVQSYETQTGNLELEGEFNSLSEDIIVDEGKIFEITTTNITGITTLGTQSYDYDTSTVSLGTLESISIGAHLSVPNGGITLRPQDPIEGTVRFNDDLNTLEFYNGVEWRQFTVTGASGRGVFAGGYVPTYHRIIQYVNISTTGNAQNFGDLTEVKRNPSGMSSSIRGVFGAGATTPAVSNSSMLEYITIASQGNAIDFGGTLTQARRNPTGASSSTRGLTAGGYTTGAVDTIDYIEIITTGGALDFGNLTASLYYPGGASSPTRAVFVGGLNSSGNAVAGISFVTFSSKGDAITFGNLTAATGLGQGCSNSTRGLFSGIGFGPSGVGINYITFSSTGNAVDFGELTVARKDAFGASNQTRGIFGAGSSPANTNIIDYVTISSTGNAIDFGDLLKADILPGACSDSHGGLGGF